ncbi:MAG: beta-N-acetylhexosaminidase [Fervidobacterium sp.]|uniref:beta-N-acetylhexosaminidase n=1 Tax=Fervidobacterium sp. TaxID=1871331 RepID=UPI00404A4525
MVTINRESIGKLFMIGIYGTELTKETREILAHIKPGFVILFSRNIVNSEQVKRLIDDISNFLGYKPVIAVDQEGGNVVRLKEGFNTLPSPMACAASRDVELFKKAVYLTSLEMKAVGVDWNLAPVVDINANPLNPVIGIRSFGDNPEIVIQFAKAFVEASFKGGIATCLKHFPGLGSVSIDPHFDMPVIEKTIDELLNFDLLPFKDVKCNAWMPSHVYFPKIQKDGLPASLSSEILDIARVELGFDGTIIVDDLLMGGTGTLSIEEKTLKAFHAGNDILTLCHEPEKQIKAFDSFCEYVKQNNDMKKRVIESLKRIEDSFSEVKSYTLPKYMDEEQFAKETKRTIDELVMKSITIVNLHDFSLPLTGIDAVLTMVGVPGSPVVDQSLPIPRIAQELSRLFSTSFDIISDAKLPEMEKLRGKRIVLFTFDMYRSRTLVNFVSELNAHSKLLLIALKNPYDVFYARNSIALYGPSTTQQEILLDVLLGKTTAEGKLPIKYLEVV